MSTPTPDPHAHAIAGITAGLASTIICHPLDYLKTRLQVSGGNVSMANGMRKILSQTSYLDLYKGVGPNLIGMLTPFRDFIYVQVIL